MYHMRIILEKGKQKEIITLAKNGFPWKYLSNKLNINQAYLSNELKNELHSLSENAYKTLCEIANVDFDQYIIEKKEDNWGRARGGAHSLGNTKDVFFPEENDKLAELFGIILGDGHLEVFKRGTKVRCYALKIAGHSKEDYNYLVNYVSNLIEDNFKQKSKVQISKKDNGMHIVTHGKNLIAFLNKNGLKSVNKKLNNQGIPVWIKNNDIYLKRCLRGLIDTDGSIHYISKKNRNLRITYTSYIPKLLKEVRDSFIYFGFNPSKVIKNNQIFLTSKKDVGKFIKEVEFKNEKHLNRVEKFKNETKLLSSRGQRRGPLVFAEV
jgi:hypothetical protein